MRLHCDRNYKVTKNVKIVKLKDLEGASSYIGFK